MSLPLIIACDLDRTVVPNGAEPFDQTAQELFTEFVSRPQVTLIYASGRHLNSIIEVLNEYQLPIPDIIVADVGTSIYWKKNEQYINDILWESKLHEDWKGHAFNDIQSLLESTIINTFKLQEPEKQGQFKLSYYTPDDLGENEVNDIKNTLANAGVKTNVVFSFDVVGKFGYLDILPASANKERALEYLQHKLNISKEQTVFAGDSGNDLDPLTSGCKGIVVNNASQDFKKIVTETAIEKDLANKLYVATGNETSNGCYTGGIMEGLRHFQLL